MTVISIHVYARDMVRCESSYMGVGEKGEEGVRVFSLRLLLFQNSLYIT